MTVLVLARSDTTALIASDSIWTFGNTRLRGGCT